MTSSGSYNRFELGQALSALGAVAAGVIVGMCLIDPNRSVLVMAFAGMAFTASLLVFSRLRLYPDRVRANQTKAMLDLAQATLDTMSEGLSAEGAQKACDLLLAATNTVAVAITSRTSILGYSGVDKELNPTNGPIRTAATHDVIEHGEMRVIRTAGKIGFPVDRHVINAAIIVPLRQGGETIGTLKFYYPHPRRITETQKSIAEGFGELLSSQLDASALEEQRQTAVSMELKALQSQINPHFLFNTLNTIAALIRTDPAKARDLVREFATFYRRTLEDSSDLIALSREVDQAQRYLMLEIARFGEDRLQFSSFIPDDAAGCLVPSFVVQPLVENAVKHAMPSEGTLHIGVEARREGNDLIIQIMDDGTGMSPEERKRIKEPDSGMGLGLAMRNINERIKSYYGGGSSMEVESMEEEGTTVVLFLKNACMRGIGSVSEL